MSRRVISLISIVSMFFLVMSCAPTKKKAKRKLIPDGEECCTLLSASVVPEIITTEGSQIVVNYKSNKPIDLSQVRAMNIIKTRYATVQINIPIEFSTPGKLRYTIFNPKITNPTAKNYGKGEYRGSGTVHLFLHRNVEGVMERVSNVLNIYATFK